VFSSLGANDLLRMSWRHSLTVSINMAVAATPVKAKKKEEKITLPPPK